ncbi:MAG TPA: threonylcarbamoyl-AMP synthase [Elusimicrobia bacterium]|nr:threonylcarbamoyl-AMP synthase [Elusimicrobiota bacterium]
MIKTKVLLINPRKPEKKKILLAAEIIKKGGLVIFPTDTVYGLAANAFLPEARKRIYRVKGRKFDKPLIFLIDEIKKIYPLISELPKEAEKLIKRYWPGPLSIIFKVSPLGVILTGGLKTIGLRIPDNKIALSLVTACGIPLATTSANLSGRESPNRAKQAIRNLKGKVELILASGETKYKLESTIIDVSTIPYRVIREGCVKKTQLEKIMKLK